jgi:hypothetical protein
MNLRRFYMWKSSYRESQIRWMDEKSIVSDERCFDVTVRTRSLDGRNLNKSTIDRCGSLF